MGMPSGRRALRWLVLTVGALESVAVVGFSVFLLSTADPLGWAIGEGIARLIAVPYVLFVVPALIVGILDRWLPLALLLVAIAVPSALLALHYA
jgi:hypothetical protein